MKPNRVQHIALSFLADAALSATALAQSASSGTAKAGKLKGSFDQPIGGRATGGGASAGGGDQTVHVTMSSSDDSGTYTVTINNGEVSAQVNGKAVPPDRI